MKLDELYVEIRADTGALRGDIERARTISEGGVAGINRSLGQMRRWVFMGGIAWAIRKVTNELAEWIKLASMDRPELAASIRRMSDSVSGMKASLGGAAAEGLRLREHLDGISGSLERNAGWWRELGHQVGRGADSIVSAAKLIWGAGKVIGEAFQNMIAPPFVQDIAGKWIERGGRALGVEELQGLGAAMRDDAAQRVERPATQTVKEEYEKLMKEGEARDRAHRRYREGKPEERTPEQIGADLRRKIRIEAYESGALGGMGRMPSFVAPPKPAAPPTRSRGVTGTWGERGATGTWESGSLGGMKSTTSAKWLKYLPNLWRHEEAEPAPVVRPPTLPVPAPSPTRVQGAIAPPGGGILPEPSAAPGTPLGITGPVPTMIEGLLTEIAGNTRQLIGTTKGSYLKG